MSDVSIGMVIERKRHSAPVAFLLRLFREKPLGMVGGVIVVLLLLTGIFANFLAPYGMNEVHPAESLVPPSSTYWLGTDNLGRDILSRVIYGARISVIVGLSASAIATFLSAFIGITSGYYGGTVDIIIQRLVDAWICFPALILLIVLISMVGTGLWQVIFVLGLRHGIGGSRIMRAATMSIKQNVYVEAARAIGCSNTRILTRHILPNVMAPMIVQFSTLVPMTVLQEASLSFLGFGIPAPNPSWGGMLGGRARDYMFDAPWMAVWPGLALSIVVYGVNMFGDAVRDLLDPRLRGGAGRYGVKAQKTTAESESTAQ